MNMLEHCQLEWITDPEPIRRLVIGWRGSGLRVGLVPTMGNLHAGHASLMRTARGQSDRVVATIFVNPTQFVAGEDFDRYPRTQEQDRVVCENEGMDAVFCPPVEVMFPPDSQTRIQVTRIEAPLCGKSRPGHFVGVATVVAKLFHIIPANSAYFGLKDYQQTRVIAQMAKDLNFPIRLEFCPTVREPDGLALSSRNAYLSPAERAQASLLYQALGEARRLFENGERQTSRIEAAVRSRLDQATLGAVDYAEIRDAETLERVELIAKPIVVAVAVRFQSARLIDNILLP